MLVSIEWLRDWVAVDGDPQRLADELTTAGLEVESVTPVDPGLPGVVVGRVAEVRPHTTAERLSVCAVDDGQGRHTVVCGAPNVVPGMLAPFARVGATVPGIGVISLREIRGQKSAGMLCSAREIGLSSDGTGLMDLADDAPIGVPLDVYLRLDDFVLDINITPNRGDCFSILGIAREIAAIRGLPLRMPLASKRPSASDRRFPVQLSPRAGCGRFAGRVVEDIRVGSRTPDWFRERLRRCGLRPIHPVVDVTNYVMLELGQPLHAYALDQLDSAIEVRRARDAEQFHLLDGKRVELDPDVLIIADASGPIGLAGIMGGERTAVTDATGDVFFESAFFTPATMLGRARRFGLHTDASMRFERGVDPTQQERAIERATGLLGDICGGRPGPLDVVELAEELPTPKPIRLRSAEIRDALGVTIADPDVEHALARLEMQATKAGAEWVVLPPPFRFDLAMETDLVEEIARLTGYDNLPAIAGAGGRELGTAPESQVDEATVADTLVARGYTEIITYSFIGAEAQRAIGADVEPVLLANPLSADLAVMRYSLWPGLLQVASQNSAHQQPRQRLFEIGTQFEWRAGDIAETRAVAGLATGGQWPEHWDAPRRFVDFFDVKGDVEAILALTGQRHACVFTPDRNPTLTQGQTARIQLAGRPIGWLGVVHPRVLKHFDLRADVVLFALLIGDALGAQVATHEHFSKLPSVRRDVAVLVDNDVPVDRLIEEVRAAAGTVLRSVRVFDLYRGEGMDSRKKSVGLGLILQDASRTLTDEDADRTVDAVVRQLERTLGAKRRT
jgi:phenylalanyl-tRNA synthetase beta chain